MSWLLPYPIASAGLLTLWLLLNQSFSPGHFLLGTGIALLGGWSLLALQLPRARPRQFRAIVRLAALVIVDIIRSNAAVGLIILGLNKKKYTSGFVQIPLELRASHGLAALACIITSTPGTLWVGFNAESGILTIHVLDLIDQTLWVDTIQGRYERLLLEIYE